MENEMKLSSIEPYNSFNINNTKFIYELLQLILFSISFILLIHTMFLRFI
jgi:hypothetical protein